MASSEVDGRSLPRRRFEWNAVTAMVAAIALVVSATGTWYAGAEIRTAKRIAKLEFLRQYYQQCQEFNDVQEKLIPGGAWHGPGNGPESSDWFRIERYMGLLEQIDGWYHDGLLRLRDLDRSYSHRVKALWAHPRIRKTLLEERAFRWEAFIDLTRVLEKAPIYSRLPGAWEEPGASLRNPEIESKTRLRVTLYPWIPDAGRDSFEGYLNRIEREFETAYPAVDLILYPMNQAQDLYKATYVASLFSKPEREDASDLAEIDMVILDTLLAADCIEAWDLTMSSDFHPSGANAVQLDGTIYAIPHWLCGHFVIARDERITQATTAHALLAALDGVEDAETDLLADFTGSWNIAAMYLDAWADTHGAQGLVHAITGEFDQTVGDTIERIAKKGDWNGRNHCLNGAFNGNERAAVLFAGGGADALIGYSERLHYVVQFDRIGRPLYINTVPLGRGSNPLLFVDGFVLRKGIDGSTKDAAEHFVEYMNNPATLEWMLLSEDAPKDSAPRYLLPANRAVYQREKVRADPYYSILPELIQHGQPFPSRGLSDNRKRLQAQMQRTLAD